MNGERDEGDEKDESAEWFGEHRGVGSMSLQAV